MVAAAAGLGAADRRAELSDPDSMLHLYRAALRIRREHPALGDGEMAWLETASSRATSACGFHITHPIRAHPTVLPGTRHWDVLLAGVCDDKPDADMDLPVGG